MVIEVGGYGMPLLVIGGYSTGYCFDKFAYCRAPVGECCATTYVGDFGLVNISEDTLGSGSVLDGEYPFDTGLFLANWNVF